MTNNDKKDCQMSLKFNIFHVHLNKIKIKCTAYSEEWGKRIHREMQNFKCQYQGLYNINMMVDYICGQIRENNEQHKRSLRAATSFWSLYVCLSLQALYTSRLVFINLIKNNIFIEKWYYYEIYFFKIFFMFISYFMKNIFLKYSSVNSHF